MKFKDPMTDLDIRLIGIDDLKNLLLWKNQHKDFFFYKELISEQQHQNWYLGYLRRPNDYMFMVEISKVSIGCMGIRMIDKRWDIYNVILGNKNFSKMGFMSVALKKMIDFALTISNYQVKLEVLSDNPAIKWYEANSFRTSHYGSDFNEMILLR